MEEEFWILHAAVHCGANHMALTALLMGFRTVCSQG